MITVIDLGIGNIGSAVKALKSLNAEIKLTNDPKDIKNASKLFLPGVGAFAAGMASIHSFGLYDPIRDAAINRRIPLLGICLGMQLLATTGYENGRCEGLGIIVGAEIVPLDKKKCPKIPHMGWNNLESTSGNPLFSGLGAKPDFYFVHSFHMVNIPEEANVSYTDYGGNITAAVSWRNVFGTQFHPEKSQANGIQVLKNFLAYA